MRGRKAAEFGNTHKDKGKRYLVYQKNLHTIKFL